MIGRTWVIRLSSNSPYCGEIFWQIDQTNRPHTTSEWVSRFFCDNWRFQYSKQTETKGSYVKTLIRKNHGKRENSQWSHEYNNSTEYSCVYNFSDTISFPDGCPGAQIPCSVVIKDADISDLHNRMNCMLRFLHNCWDNRAWLLWLMCKDIWHCS